MPAIQPQVSFDEAVRIIAITKQEREQFETWDTALTLATVYDRDDYDEIEKQLLNHWSAARAARPQPTSEASVSR